MGFYAKVMEKKAGVLESGERKLIFKEMLISDKVMEEIALSVLRPDYSRSAMLASFDELEGLRLK